MSGQDKVTPRHIITRQPGKENGLNFDAEQHDVRARHIDLVKGPDRDCRALRHIDPHSVYARLKFGNDMRVSVGQPVKDKNIRPGPTRQNVVAAQTQNGVVAVAPFQCCRWYRRRLGFARALQPIRQCHRPDWRPSVTNPSAGHCHPDQ